MESGIPCRDLSPYIEAPLAKEDIINLRKDSADTKGSADYNFFFGGKMADSIHSQEVLDAFRRARIPRKRKIILEGKPVELPYPSPEEWRDEWIYFILLNRFSNPDSPPRHLPWDGEWDQFQGGTLNGVRGQLPYLRDLGAGAIWLSPVLKNRQYTPYTYHGCGIQNFLTVDPRFSSNPQRARRDPAFADSELRALVDEAHAMGMYVIFDIVLNHTGDVFEYAGIGRRRAMVGYALCRCIAR
jgi:hypothetical protein